MLGRKEKNQGHWQGYGNCDQERNNIVTEDREWKKSNNQLYDHKKMLCSNDEPASNNYLLGDEADESRKQCFRINWMSMKDIESGYLIWKSDDWNSFDHSSNQEQKAMIPSSILECPVVSREINFSSTEEISNLSLVQKFMMKEVCVEEWSFAFGYVIPNSTNTWQQIIKSAGKERMMSPNMLSGNVTIDTSFYDGDSLISRSTMRIFYT